MTDRKQLRLHRNDVNCLSGGTKALGSFGAMANSATSFTVSNGEADIAPETSPKQRHKNESGIS
jgi:hypothetical protein